MERTFRSDRTDRSKRTTSRGGPKYSGRSEPKCRLHHSEMRLETRIFVNWTHVSVRPDRPVKEDHLQRWSQIFRSEQTETNLSIWLQSEISGNFGSMESTQGYHKSQITCKPMDYARTGQKTLFTMAAMLDSEGANNTSSRGYNEHFSHTDDLFHVHWRFIT